MVLLGITYLTTLRSFAEVVRVALFAAKSREMTLTRVWTMVRENIRRNTGC